MTRRKKQAYALRETAVAGAQAPREGFTEITSGKSRRQQGAGSNSQRLHERQSRSALPYFGLSLGSRVENRRSNCSLPVDSGRGFRRVSAVRFGLVLFPVPAHRTGLADFPHPALGKGSFGQLKGYSQGTAFATFNGTG